MREADRSLWALGALPPPPRPRALEHMPETLRSGPCTVVTTSYLHLLRNFTQGTQLWLRGSQSRPQTPAGRALPLIVLYMSDTGHHAPHNPPRWQAAADAVPVL